VWAFEDGLVVEPDNRWLALATTMRPMLNGVVDA
jgi:hypothetical protein